MSDAWHHYEQASAWGRLLLPALVFLFVVCAIALVRLQRRITRLEGAAYAVAAVALAVSCRELAAIGLALLVLSGFPDALWGLAALAPVVLGAAVLLLLVKKVRSRQL